MCWGFHFSKGFTFLEKLCLSLYILLTFTFASSAERLRIINILPAIGGNRTLTKVNN